MGKVMSLSVKLDHDHVLLPPIRHDEMVKSFQSSHLSTR